MSQAWGEGAAGGREGTGKGRCQIEYELVELGESRVLQQSGYMLARNARGRSPSPCAGLVVAQIRDSRRGRGTMLDRPGMQASGGVCVADAGGARGSDCE